MDNETLHTIHSFQKCVRCGDRKSSAEFYRRNSGSLRLICKTCHNLVVSLRRKNNPQIDRAYRQKIIEKRRAYDRQRNATIQRKNSFILAGKKWRSLHPEWRAIQILFTNAVKRGEIQRMPCFICGDERAEGHHADYGAPFSVTWLCTTHHRQVHAMIRRKDASV